MPSAAAYLLAATGMAAGSQIWYLLLRPSVYEYAILSGAAFVLLGLWQWLLAANTPTEKRARLVFHLVLGSLCIALVAGCRPQMEVFAVLALPIFWKRYVTGKRLVSRAGAGEAAAFLLPVIAVAAVLLWYNAARFGSPFDFGATYNLTSNDMTRRGFSVGAGGSGCGGLPVRRAGIQHGVPLSQRHPDGHQLYGTDHHRTVLRRVPLSACPSCGGWQCCPWPGSGCRNTGICGACWEAS